MHRDYNGYNYDTLKFIFLHEVRKRSWHYFCFTVSVKKHDWIIHENLFA